MSMSVSIILGVLTIKHTITSTPYSRIQRGYKIRHDGVRIVEPRKNRYDVGARIRIFLGKSGIEEDCQGLSGKRMENWVWTFKGKERHGTSRAISSAGAFACLTRRRAWRKSCCERACWWSISSGAIEASVRFKPAVSGRWRKNSCQNPSDNSTSSSSSWGAPLH